MTGRAKMGLLLVPCALVLYFLIREERPFAAAVCCWWLGESLINVAIYMADARSLALPFNVAPPEQPHERRAIRP